MKTIGYRVTQGFNFERGLTFLSYDRDLITINRFYRSAINFTL